jgi:hypothetical protein
VSLNRIQASGVYAGNGSSQTITIGWQPALIIISSDATGGPQTDRATSYKMASMAAAGYMSGNSSAEYKTSNGITITSTGFSVGSNDDINDSGDNFYWTAFRAGPWIDTGSYTGTGSNGSVTTGRQPSFVFLAEDAAGSDTMMWKNARRAAAGIAKKTSGYFINEGGITLTSTGFDISENAIISGSTYYWIALYSQVGGTRHFEVGSYTGNGSGQTITLGYQPISGIIIGDGAQGTAIKAASMSAAATATTAGLHVWSTTNGITFLSTGFSVGSSNTVNANNVNYNFIMGLN